LEEIAFLENTGAPLQLYGSAAFLKTCETLHDMLEIHLQASSTSDSTFTSLIYFYKKLPFLVRVLFIYLLADMSIPAILPRFAAAEMLKLCLKGTYRSPLLILYIQQRKKYKSPFLTEK
jgi:hypothetical protein